MESIVPIHDKNDQNEAVVLVVSLLLKRLGKVNHTQSYSHHKRTHKLYISVLIWIPNLISEPGCSWATLIVMDFTTFTEKKTFKNMTMYYTFFVF